MNDVFVFALIIVALLNVFAIGHVFLQIKRDEHVLLIADIAIIILMLIVGFGYTITIGTSVLYDYLQTKPFFNKVIKTYEKEKDQITY